MAELTGNVLRDEKDRSGKALNAMLWVGLILLTVSLIWWIAPMVTGYFSSPEVVKVPTWQETFPEVPKKSFTIPVMPPPPVVGMTDPSKEVSKQRSKK